MAEITGTAGADMLPGTTADDLIDGLAGNDQLNGLAGNDTLIGGDGNDTLLGGDGDDRLDGGTGNDLLDASGGSAESQGNGDYVRPGLGHDTIIGHAGHWSTGEGVDLSYGNLYSGIGGLTVTVGTNGTGTAISGDGRVNDTFSYVHHIEGSHEDDLLSGSDADRYEGWSPLGGNDTVHGGAGWDVLFYSYEAEYFGGAGSGITANVAAGTVVDTQGDTDVFSGIDELRGSQRDDTLDASGQGTGMFLRGEGGADTLRGGSGNDTLDGGEGRDNLYGGAGNDMIDAGGGSTASQGSGDYVRPGRGSDTIMGHEGLFAADEGIDLSYEDVSGVGGLTINVGPNGTGTAVSGTAGLVNDSFTYAHYFAGSLDNDIFIGSDNANWEGWVGSDGNDTIHGRGGYDELLYNNDHHRGGMGGVTVNFATGQAVDPFGDTDTFTGIEAARGTSQNDVMTGSAALDFVSFRGLAGNDTLTGSSSWDRADYSADANYGGTGGVTVDLAAGTATDGFGTFDTLSSIDHVRGTGSGDIMTAAGLARSVRFDGDGGDDLLTGGSADDRLFGGDGVDTLVGGAGDDLLLGGASDNDLRDVIYGGDGQDEIDGGHGNDELRGDAGNDTITGGSGVDTIIGGTGDDVLTGQTWSDVVLGGNGNDFINGGFGHDRVNGGAHADRFYHLGVEGHGSDWIQDFSDAEGDVLVFGGTGSLSDFQVNFSETEAAGQTGVEEAFVIYKPTQQILWALVDGAAQDHIDIVIGGQEFDLLG